MTDKERIKKGKELAFLLRHDKNYKFKEGGWREISDLTKNHGYTKVELEEIVKTDSKRRYEFSSPNPSMIRAVQGHSVDIEMGYTEKEPPEYLYHGTSQRFLDSIKQEGLKPMSRQYVHLSRDTETAEKVGTRHGGYLAIIIVHARKMWEDGYKFYQANNGVWLTKAVPWKKEYVDLALAAQGEKD